MKNIKKNFVIKMIPKENFFEFVYLIFFFHSYLKIFAIFMD